MNYEETIAYLYHRLPAFHRVGGAAMKAGLTNITALCSALGDPHTHFKSIHVAGTNGKGSTSHMLSAILQSAGYKVGLHTSPHLKSFTERFKINGCPCSEETICAFVAENRGLIEKIQPSFFEISVALAFDYFAKEKVDIAVIEVGLGGRLDSTNIITPILSVITNISLDHTEFLGNTLPLIAAEKAGIIKPHIPVVVSETHPETEPVFRAKATEADSKIVFGDQQYEIIQSTLEKGKRVITVKSVRGETRNLAIDLLGVYQTKNVLGVLQAVDELKMLGWELSDQQVNEGLANATKLSQLKGRWQVLQEQPIVIADVAHNYGGLNETLSQLRQYEYTQLRFVLGFVKDKDVAGVLELFPKDAHYYFCAADLPRSLPADELKKIGNDLGLKGNAFASVHAALEAAQTESSPADFIYVGGSTFVVAEV